ncbi:hypothetical protein LP420_29445 [Massilia sp. B-10]|nr:hypothetical protein LP420_29445 [Massilia sp. B-10]
MRPAPPSHADLTQAIVSNTPGLVYEFILYADGSVDFPYLSEGCPALLGLLKHTRTAAPSAPLPRTDHAGRPQGLPRFDARLGRGADRLELGRPDLDRRIQRPEMDQPALDPRAARTRLKQRALAGHHDQHHGEQAGTARSDALARPPGRTDGPHRASQGTGAHPHRARSTTTWAAT